MVASPKKAPKAAPAHPKYAVMIKAAVTGLANRKGSSMKAISAYIQANYKGLGDNHERLLKAALKRELASGALAKKTGLGCIGSFKLGEKAVAAPKKKKVAPKKKPAAKAAPKKKATTPKKKPAAKSAPKKKKATTPKKKVAAKKVTAKKAAPKKAAPKKAKK